MKKIRWAGALVVLAILGAWGCQNVSRPVTSAARQAGPATTEAVAEPRGGKHGEWPADIAAALDRLSGRDAAERAAGLKVIARTIERNSRDASLMVNIAGQFKEHSARKLALLLSTEDIEARALIARLMDFEDALSRFILVAAEEPEPRRGTVLRWGLSEGGSKVVALAFSSDMATRAEAAHVVGETEGEAADWVLARLIDDAEREVCLNAIDAAWERNPSPVVVDALWQKAVAYPLMQFRVNMGLGGAGRQARIAVMHGRTIQLDGYDYTLAARMQDGDVATDLLVAYKSELVETKLTEFMSSLAGMKASQNFNPFQMLSASNGMQGQDFERLVLAYRPKAAVLFLVHVVAGQFNGDGWQQMMNNQMYRYSTRIDALGMLVKLTDQDKDDYNLVRAREWGNRWMLSGTDEGEEKSVKKMLAWWKGHYKDYGAKSAEFAEEDIPKSPNPSWRAGKGNG